MANNRETQPLRGEHPSFVMMRILMDMDELPPEDDEGRKERLRLEGDQDTYKGFYRYDLLLGLGEDGQGYCSLKLTPEGDIRMGDEEWEEIARSRSENVGREPVRTGYIEIEDEAIIEFSPVGIFRDSSPMMQEIVGLHFPEHELVLRDIDK